MALLRTPFFDDHVACGGKMIDFGGWELPVQYSSLGEEHKAVRAGVGLFDVSHMGEVRVTGPRAADALNALCCNDATAVPVGMSQYSAIVNDDGGLVDDIFIYRLGEEDFFVVVNAANRAKDFAWFVERNPFPGEAVFEDQGEAWAQVAVQGRHAAAVVQALTDLDISAVPRFGVTVGSFAGVDGCVLARTGYTGEDGLEIWLPADGVAGVWQAILDAGADHGIVPVGLGARDTLRLEAKNVLYGNDIDDTTSPLEAGLRWIVKLETSFTGRDRIAAQKEAGLTRRLVALEVDKRIPRQHNAILRDGEVVGEVTSGTRSPLTGKNIALGYVARGHGRLGTELTIDIRGRSATARVVKPPFFQRDY